MKTDVPKQFLEISGKPIIVYSIENFQRNAQIDKILVVCVKEWISHLQQLIKDYNLSKVEWVISGGKTGHDSIKNGVFFLNSIAKPDDFVIIHDAVRPILPQKAKGMFSFAYVALRKVCCTLLTKRLKEFYF